MKTFGAEPLELDVGIIKCRDCMKPILRSAISEHSGEQFLLGSKYSFLTVVTDNCAKIRSGGKKGIKGKLGAETEAGMCMSRKALVFPVHFRGGR